MKPKPYRRRIHYYETDQMQVVHHANYARFLEEARLDFMEQIGLNYRKLEELGIVIPVLELHDYYRDALHYDDEIEITLSLTRLTPVRFTVQYQIVRLPDSHLVHQAETSHAFLNADFRPMNLKKHFPEIYQKLQDVLSFQNHSTDEGQN